MSKVIISKENDPVFGNLVTLTNGIAVLKVTVDFGPRIIHFSLDGMENMLYQDKAMGTLGETFDIYGGEVCKLYGGQRIWISPEILPRCYYPDNKPVTYREFEDGVEFTAPVEEFNNIQKIMTIILDPDDARVNLIHTIKNCGMWDIELAPWCITMMDKGGKAVVPQPVTNTGLLANRNISLWPYSEMNDPRVYFGKNYITLTQNPDMTNPFKFGINNDSENGWAAYFNKGQLFIKTFEPDFDGFYPDNGCSYETYTNGVMLESETLGELVSLEPEETVSHEETWFLYKENRIPSNDEDEIEDLLIDKI